MTEEIELPPLPPADGIHYRNWEDSWSKPLLEEYARQAVLAERERCGYDGCLVEPMPTDGVPACAPEGNSRHPLMPLKGQP